MSGIPEEFVFEDRYMSRKKVDKILGNLFGPVDGKWYREQRGDKMRIITPRKLTKSEIRSLRETE
ncbi:uncharacterized protein H6S33_010004 [Morchella sextelata]|uniref:uncharacterized protein n=1 Tax=Morchella sextelata TaxID=1174677 RepID=UPI001D041AB0|nr:uncharacterized protein H6S33_010004 [Morchella sextelata]KAH0611952.1 hypothetical protein H6S33_010004 [Morchella sextelata]